MKKNSHNSKRKFYKKKRFKIIASIVILLVIARLALPYIVKNYVNKTLANIPEYYGHVEDIDISLYRGAYTIKDLYLNKVNAKSQVPFLNFPKTDISIEWKSLFKGSIVSEIIMYNPQVTYILEDQEATVNGEQAELDDWTTAITDLVPLEINHFEVHNGKVGIAQITTEPSLDLYMDDVEFTAENLRNVVENNNKLPSPISGSGVSIGNGNFNINGAINLIKTIPDLDIDFELTNASVTSVNDFTRHYGGIDFEYGNIDVFGEIAIANSYLKGYIKPMLKDSKLIGKDDGILSTIWEGFVGLFKFILKNQGTKTLATKVPLEGDLNNVNAGIFPTIINIFENGWIKAFKTEVDKDIKFKDALNNAKK
ncbi:DUF748 domain-containing protein [Neotamlana laminarinivorans]|uniref:DUF748 domain-containing protein n=1 Tax=Neotamlana laminarinivorans TaxID=2883124 RepID=A0A9X1L2B9_9FLAO|nr:DUF748 domain-containing protein [Tamlana laminarinivorans]MCB4799680.1 DUF748 domain-containing protein [Tamlana laminarinivorans]